MTNVSKAVVLAAGTGSRLGKPHPKPLTPVRDVPILHRSLHNLASAGVTRVVLVVGHRADEIRASIGDEFAGVAISYVVSEEYRTTNNAYSLWLAREHLDEDVFLVEGDVLFDADLLGEMAAVDAPAVSAVAPWRRDFNGTVVALDAHQQIAQMYLGAQQGPGLRLERTFKTVNVHLLRKEYLAAEFVPSLERLIEDGGNGAYYELVLADTVERGKWAVRAVDCRHLRWYEVDDATDLAAADYLFGTADQRLRQLQGMHGGLWRHEVVDHCLLYNLYFPTPKLLDEMAAEFREALVHYPVGHRALHELLAAVVGQPAERLVIANGASELIKIIGRQLGRVALAVPGFNEYEAVFEEQLIHRIELPAPTFELDVDAFFRSARDAGVDAVIITSPNNPTSMAVPRADLLRLCRLLGAEGITFVVDESFVDFCEPGQSLEPELAAEPNLVIVKSMSKAYGIGGLRLGYLTSADLAFIDRIRAELPIWNVNGFAESFLRLLPRYQAEFRASCLRVREDRDHLRNRLSRIDGLHAYPADANYVMVRLPESWNGPEVTQALFRDHGILIKDCAGKSMADGERYLRIACRSKLENERLAVALERVLGATSTDLPAFAVSRMA